jgi:hypothetical protein
VALGGTYFAAGTASSPAGSATTLTARLRRTLPNVTTPADQCEQGVIPAASHAVPGVEMGASLADQDLARVDPLTTEPLHAQPLCGGVTSVAAG